MARNYTRPTQEARSETSPWTVLSFAAALVLCSSQFAAAQTESRPPETWLSSFDLGTRSRASTLRARIEDAVIRFKNQRRAPLSREGFDGYILPILDLATEEGFANIAGETSANELKFLAATCTKINRLRDALQSVAKADWPPQRFFNVKVLAIQTHESIELPFTMRRVRILESTKKRLGIFIHLAELIDVSPPVRIRILATRKEIESIANAQSDTHVSPIREVALRCLSGTNLERRLRLGLTSPSIDHVPTYCTRKGDPIFDCFSDVKLSRFSESLNMPPKSLTASDDRIQVMDLVWDLVGHWVDDLHLAAEGRKPSDSNNEATSRPCRADFLPKIKLAREECTLISSAVNNYFNLNRRELPASIQDLFKTGRYGGAPTLSPTDFPTRIPTDPWGQPYVLKCDGASDFEIISYGADGSRGGEGANADISSRDAPLRNLWDWR